MKKIIIIPLCATLIPGYLLFSYIFNTPTMHYPEDKMYFCTAADEKFFPHVLNLIGSLHKLHFDDIQEIAVFDLGFKAEQRAHINSIDKVVVRDVELTHPDLLKPMESRPGKVARGLWAWKSVCIKQSLDRYPFVLWMNAGTTILGSVQPIFELIKERGTFLTECGHNVKIMTTQRVIKEFNLTSPDRSWILDENNSGVDAGLIGVSRKYYDNFIYPLYKFSYNMDIFVDDGTAAGGPGWGRQDQTLVSVLTHLLKLPIYKKDFNIAQDNREHIYETIKIGDNDIRMHFTEIPRQVHNQTTIFRSRNFMPWFNQLTSAIKFRSQGTKHETYA